MGHLLERVSSEESLIDAWSDIRRRSMEGGEASPEVAAFSRTAAGTIAGVATALRLGVWKPSPVHPVHLPKPTGGRRTLGIPPLADRIVERAILGVLDPIVDPVLSPWCFGYRRGLGTQDAVRSLIDARDDGATWVVRCDIADCFDRIRRGELLKLLSVHVPDSDLMAVLTALVRRPVLDRGPRSRGLHQGSPLSPLFANLYLDRLDRSMLRAGHQVIRYADDLAVPVPSQHQGHEVIELLQQQAATLGLKLRSAKTAVMSFEEGVGFLGSVVTAATTPPESRFDHLTATAVFITREGSVLRSRGHRMRVECDGEEPFTLAFDRMRQVVIFGRVHLTTAFMQQLLRRGIDLTMLDSRGQYFGRLQGGLAGDPFLRAAQYGLNTRTEHRLELAQRIVAGKIANQRVLLLRRGRSGHVGLRESIDRLANARERAHATRSINELSGVEGAAGREYFRAFGLLLTNGFEFHTRRRRPPPDPVNSMLSFGYALLIQEVIGAVESAGLDPHEGVLHKRRIGRPSLALDLVEEFRPVIVDAVVLRAVSQRMLTVEDFEYSDSTDVSCRLGTEGRRRFLREYERRMLTMVSHAPSGRRVSYRVAMALQAKHLASELVGGRHRYEPMVWK
jgi:CRISPR-associated protein Cas1